LKKLKALSGIVRLPALYFSGSSHIDKYFLDGIVGSRTNEVVIKTASEDIAIEK